MTVKAVLVDLSGTLHVGNHVIPGAIEACRRLQQAPVEVRFLTNTTKTSRIQLLTQLRDVGFTEREIPDIVTTTGIVRELISHRNLKPLCLLESELVRDDLQDLMDADDTEQEYNSVLVGLAPTELCYFKLNQAFRILLRQQPNDETDHPTLIALHKAKYYKDADGQLSLGPGGFVSCLEEAASVKALIVGKPNKEFFHSAIPPGISPEETAMVGDDVISDVVGAKNAGIEKCILVKTGKYRQGDELKDSEKVDHVVDSIVEAVELILSWTEKESTM